MTIDGNNENDLNNDKDLWIRTSSCPYHLTYQPTTATCTAAGKQGYYTCSICKRIYLNENATGETTLADLPAAGPLGHNLTPVPAKPATCTEDGNIEYYCCNRDGCGKLFSDADGTQELTADDVVLPMLVRTDDLPQTGDSSHLLGWAALFGACCAGAVVLNKRRR